MFYLIFRQRFSCWLNIVGTTSDTNVVFTLTNNTKRHQAAARFNVNTLRSTLSLLHIHTNMGEGMVFSSPSWTGNIHSFLPAFGIPQGSTKQLWLFRWPYSELPFPYWMRDRRPVPKDIYNFVEDCIPRDLNPVKYSLLYVFRGPLQVFTSPWSVAHSVAIYEGSREWSVRVAGLDQ